MSSRPGNSSSVPADGASSALAELMRAHEDLLAGISDLEAQTRLETPDADALAKVRWRLSQASRARRRLVDAACERLLESSTPVQAARIQTLRDNSAETSATSSSHVRTWTIERVVADWQGYRRASASMRRQMRDRISAETTVLYPLLGPVRS
jgi:hypothetical protein